MKALKDLKDQRGYKDRQVLRAQLVLPELLGLRV